MAKRYYRAAGANKVRVIRLRAQLPLLVPTRPVKTEMEMVATEEGQSKDQEMDKEEQKQCKDMEHVLQDIQRLVDRPFRRCEQQKPIPPRHAC